MGAGAIALPRLRVKKKKPRRPMNPREQIALRICFICVVLALLNLAFVVAGSPTAPFNAVAAASQSIPLCREWPILAAWIWQDDDDE